MPLLDLRGGTVRLDHLDFGRNLFLRRRDISGTGPRLSVSGGLEIEDTGIVITAGGLDVTGNLGFYGATPIAQPSAYTQTFSTADKTHAAATTATLTDSTGGTAADTLAATTNPTAVDVTGTGTCADSAETNTALGVLADRDATLAREQARIVADIDDVKRLCNSIIDDLQSLGLVG